MGGTRCITWHEVLHETMPLLDHLLYLVYSHEIADGTCRYHMQGVKGDNTAERPMWAEKGGLDFEGRARWDAWSANKVRQV